MGIMLLKAYEREKPTIARRAGYTRALESLGADFQILREELVMPWGLGG